MIAVIIAGGSGTRLWPLSTPARPKHLLKIAHDEFSLLQRTYQRARLLTETIYIVTEASQVQQIKAQLPELPEEALLIEPGKRGPAYCIAAALVEIAKRHDPTEPVSFLHADHYVHDTAGFVHTLTVAGAISQAHVSIVLVGVQPTYPATGFGYIHKGSLIDNQTFAYRIAGFKEKPDFPLAQSYLRTGSYLWNAGYYIGSVQTFLDTMRTYAPDFYADYQKLAAAGPEEYSDVYLGFEANDIDYLLSEKADNLLVIPADFDWLDIGSYKDLHSIAAKDTQMNHLDGQVELEDVTNTFVKNLEDKPVVVIGIDNAVVVNTPDGLLVTRQDLSQKVGPVSQRLYPKSTS